MNRDLFLTVLEVGKSKSLLPKWYLIALSSYDENGRTKEGEYYMKPLIKSLKLIHKGCVHKT